MKIAHLIKFNNLGIIIMVLVLVSCASNVANSTEPSEPLKSIISQKTFTINSYWAKPQYTAAMAQLNGIGLLGNNSVGGTVDISGHVNYFTMRNDSIIAKLPYYGERQMGRSSINIDEGININGIPKDMKTEFKDGKYVLSFSIEDNISNNEIYQIRVSVFSNLSSIIDINSSHRFSIRYDGEVIRGDKAL